jgi:hypothetical protein
MADLKFSEFTEQTTEAENLEYVGFDGIQNIRIKKDNPKKALYSMMVINGFAISHDTDTDHDILFGAGSCPDSTNAMILTGSAMVKRVDASWSAGTGNGGLFSGSVSTNVVYYMFVIRKDSDGSIDYGFDTSIIAANRPAGWTYYRLIGVGVTNASSNWHLGTWIRKGVELLFTYKSFIVDRASTTAGTGSRELNTVTVPPNMIGNFHIQFQSNGVSGWYYWSGETFCNNLSPVPEFIVINGTAVGFEQSIQVDVNSQIATRQSSGNGWTSIVTRGFVQSSF